MQVDSLIQAVREAATINQVVAVFRVDSAKGAYVTGKAVAVTGYHGTNADFDNFSLDFAPEGGIFFTDEKTHAMAYGRNIKTADLALRSPYVVAGAEIPESHDQQDIIAVVQEAKRAGHDSVVITNMRDHGSISNTFIVFSGDQITLHESKSAQADQQEPEAPADLLGGQPTAFTIIPEGRDNQVKTAKGTKVSTKFAVVEVSDLIVSHDEQGGENPLYPQVLQPRDRGRASSQAWVHKTSNDLDPDMLGRTRRADTGAPIVGPDGIVESGNGRTMAIRTAYRQGRADDYLEWLLEEASTFGLNPAKIKAMREPVLVRVRTSEVDRAAFAVEANQDDKLAMTATEKARSDARRLTPALMERFKPGGNGDLLAASNRDFLRGFLESLGDAEAAQYVTSKGQPTGPLIARVQAAIFAKAYEDERLLELMADTAKPEIQNIITALNAAAPDFIKAKNVSKAGATEAAEKLADGIELSLDQQSVKAVIDATNVVRAAREADMPVSDYVAQMGLFGDVPADVAALAVFIAQNNRSSKRMATAFKAIAEFVNQEMERGQNFDMFGERTVDMVQVIEAANRAIEREYGEGQFAIQKPAQDPGGGLFESVRYGAIDSGFFK